jgi:hypothetical protein
MDVAEILVTAGGILLIALTLWFFFDKPKTKPSTRTAGGAYACPMHPWIVSDDLTATCSLCGMQLVRQETGPKGGMQH